MMPTLRYTGCHKSQVISIAVLVSIPIRTRSWERQWSGPHVLGLIGIVWSIPGMRFDLPKMHFYRCGG